MTLNELCTNTTKFGALSVPGGHVESPDHRSEQRAVAFDLTERGGPAVQAPTRRSFGTRLIDTLGKQLNGTVEMTYDLKGFIYALDVPLSPSNRPIDRANIAVATFLLRDEADSFARKPPDRKLKRGPYADKSPLPAAVNVPNDLCRALDAVHRQPAFKKAPRLLAGAKDMHYITVDGRKIIDAAAGMWCCNAGHGRSQISAAIAKQAEALDYAPPFQFGIPRPSNCQPHR